MPEDYHTLVVDLDGGDLQFSTLVESSRNRADWTAATKQCCLFCGKWYKYRPSLAEVHLDAGLTLDSVGTARKVTACQPTVQHTDRHAEVLAELRRRRQIKDEERKAAEKRNVEGGAASSSGKERDPIVIGGGADPTQSSLVPVVTPVQVHEAWGKTIAACGLPVHIVDDPFFRDAVRLTAMCGMRMICMGPDRTLSDTTLPHRTTYSTKIIPDLDKRTDAAVMNKMEGVLQQLGGALISDGWESTTGRPIVNMVLAANGHSVLRAAIDTTGETKTMEFIADLVVKHINEVGGGKIVAVCMDGACKGAFKYIIEKCPWVQCFVCPSHGVDNFIKNMCSSTDSINMQANPVTGEPVSSQPWGHDFFEKTFEDAYSVIKFVSRHQKPLARYRHIALHLSKDEKPNGGTAILKYGDTRYGSRVLMGERMLSVRVIYERLTDDGEFNAWLRKQSKRMKEKVCVRLRALARACVR